jgi:hypothetical protein
MKLTDRVRNIMLSPKSEWPAIDGETATAQSLLTGYVMILAAIGPVVAIVVSLGRLTVSAAGQYVIALAMTGVVAFIADALSPAFGGSKDFVRSLKLVAYSWTAVWVAAGVAALVPPVGGLLMVAALLYAFYTFRLGAPVLARASAEKATGYTVVVALCALVIALLLGALFMPLFIGTSMMGMGRMWV